MEKYLEAGTVDAAELAATLAKAVADGSLVPILFAAGRADKGVDGDNGLHRQHRPVARRPGSARPKKGDAEVEVAADPNAPFAAFAFKAMTDPYVGKLSFLRVFRGTLTGDMSVYNVRTESRHRVGHIYRMQGREQKEIQKAIPGDIIALAKIEAIEVNDSRHGRKRADRVRRRSFSRSPWSASPSGPRPRRRAAHRGRPQQAHRRGQDLHCRPRHADRRARHHRHEHAAPRHHAPEAQEPVRRRGRDVRAASIPYKETITGKAEARYRHKKQTGGRGQFGEVFISVEPLERGAGFEFVDEVVGGRVPNQYIPAVEKGVREQLVKGVISGNVVEDVRVALFDGSFHPVDSSEAAFKLAARRLSRKPS